MSNWSSRGASGLTAWPMAGYCAKEHLTISGFSPRPAMQAGHSVQPSSYGISSWKNRGHLAGRSSTRKLPRALGIPRSRLSALSGSEESASRSGISASLIEHVAGLLADGKVVGWFQGRMEFGPRRSGRAQHPGRPRSPSMQATMNLKIKFRESFRPFAPAVLWIGAARVVRPPARPGKPVHAAGGAGTRRSPAFPSTPRPCR